jgi:hypothetical protein
MAEVVIMVDYEGAGRWIAGDLVDCKSLQSELSR